MLYPLPAVMVSCKDRENRPNIITVAWTGTVCTDPPMVYISLRKSRYSYELIKDSGEFVINLVTYDLARAADYCGVRSGRDVDKFEQMHLHLSPSKTIDTCGIAESPVCIECRVRQILPLGTHDMFLAEVAAVGINEEYLDETGRFQLNDAGLIAYSHGEYYRLGEYIGKFGYSVAKRPSKHTGRKKSAQAARKKNAKSGRRPARKKRN